MGVIGPGLPSTSGVVLASLDVVREMPGDSDNESWNRVVESSKHNQVQVHSPLQQCTYYSGTIPDVYIA